MHHEETDYYSKVTALNDTFYEMSYFIKEQLIAKVNFKYDIIKAFDKTGDFSIFHNGNLNFSSKYDIQAKAYFVDVYYPVSDQLFYSYSYKKDQYAKPVYYYSQMFRENGEEVMLEGELEIFDPIQQKILYNTYKCEKLISSYIKEGEKKCYFVTDSTVQIDLYKLNYELMQEFEVLNVQRSFQKNLIGTTFLVLDIDKDGYILKTSYTDNLNSDFNKEMRRIMKKVFEKDFLRLKPSSKLDIFDDNDNVKLRCMLPITFITQPNNLSPVNNNYWMMHNMFEQQFFMHHQMMHQQTMQHIMNNAPTF